MPPELERPSLPTLLVVSDGRHPMYAPPGVGVGILVRDTDLAALVHRAGSGCPPDALDIDSVAGLGSDQTAVEFVTERLGIRIVLTRRPQVAARAAERGHLGLVHVYAYDSTGLARSLDGHPGVEGVGSVVSPGLVVAHLRPDELARLPRPIVAYGLIDTVEGARACQALVDAIVVRPVIAARLAAVELATA